MRSEMTLDEAIIIAARIMAEETPAAQCAWETIESRVGACDGGERCRNQATCERNGILYCNKHGMD